MSDSQDGTTRRILYDIAHIQEEAHPDFKVVEYTNIRSWTVLMKGPEGSVFEDYPVVLFLNFPASYPFDPPTVRVGFDIFHPNVYPMTMFFALEMLQWEMWRPYYDAYTVLDNVHSSLGVPSAKCIVNWTAAKKYENRVHYECAVRTRMEVRGIKPTKLSLDHFPVCNPPAKFEDRGFRSRYA